jgi:hypothetical protein
LITHRLDLDRYIDLNRERTRKRFTLYDRRVDAGDSERNG